MRTICLKKEVYLRRLDVERSFIYNIYSQQLFFSASPSSPQPSSSQPSGNPTPLNKSSTPTSSKPSTTKTNDNAPAVSLSIISPTPDKFQFHKKGFNITFAWKFVGNFSTPPKSLNIYAIPNVYHGTNKNFTIATNLTGSTTEYEWDTSKQTNPELPDGPYNLWILDERGIDYYNNNGKLAPFNGFIFTMYAPSPAIPTEYCQGKRIPTSAYLMGSMESFANVLIPMTSLITLITFLTGIFFLNNHGFFEN
ncbi:8852_t:CDS:2 [Diversispora eburnea]|uniref:8852_t:CDS:1 n=1 Tax=Diversispora eburnea TaxID=1213867 RepID=A0A9N8W376_9GLOM|nr:8852_t:CDS:2 [Diversispora eburnea]